jgi:heme A synthase
MQCPNCGTINPPNTAFCVNCRNQIVFFQPPPQQQLANPFLHQQNIAEPDSQTSKWFSILLYVFCGITIFWMIYSYFIYEWFMDDFNDLGNYMTFHGWGSLFTFTATAIVLVFFAAKTESKKLRILLICFLVFTLIKSSVSIYNYFSYVPIEYGNF